jgi:hypothetical protein
MVTFFPASARAVENEAENGTEAMASANKKLRRKESKMFIEMGGRNQGADGKGERAKGQGESAGVEEASVRESKTEFELEFEFDYHFRNEG